jgi:hypothetical protein
MFYTFAFSSPAGLSSPENTVLTMAATIGAAVEGAKPAAGASPPDSFILSPWLVEALTRAGRTEPARLEEARLLFEQMLGYANHLGLYAEQTGSSGEALGNFPQAFTHLALISAAFNLDRTLGSR